MYTCTSSLIVCPMYSALMMIIIAGSDKLGRDHDAIWHEVLRICRQENLKLNKDKCLFRCANTPFFEKVISQQGVILDPWKVNH